MVLAPILHKILYEAHVVNMLCYYKMHVGMAEGYYNSDKESDWGTPPDGAGNNNDNDNNNSCLVVGVGAGTSGT